MRPHLASGLAWLLARGASGRRGLARSTGLGEIAVRQEVERLGRLGLVAIDRRGTRLTARGREEFAAILARVKEVRELQLWELALDQFTLGAVVAGAGGAEAGPGKRASWQLRDLAVREGASGALLIAYTASVLRFSDSSEPVGARNPRDAELLRTSFSEFLEEGDLLVLVCAAGRRAAYLGLWRIILELVGSASAGLAPG